MSKDRLSEILDMMRLRAENLRGAIQLQDAPEALLNSVRKRAAADQPRLLAAVDGVLAWADQWQALPPSIENAALRDCGQTVRKAITAALLGEETAP